MKTPLTVAAADCLRGIARRIHGDFDQQVWLAKEYSKADLIEDLLDTASALLTHPEAAGWRIPEVEL